MDAKWYLVAALLTIFTTSQVLSFEKVVSGQLNSSFEFAIDDITLNEDVEKFFVTKVSPVSSNGKERVARSLLVHQAANNDTLDENEKIMAAYTDASGTFRVASLKAKNLSPSWVWAANDDDMRTRADFEREAKSRYNDTDEMFTQTQAFLGDFSHHFRAAKQDPSKVKRRLLRQARRRMRLDDLVEENEEKQKLLEKAAIEQTKGLDTTVRNRYSFWRREHHSTSPDFLLKILLDQIIMARVYASIAHSKGETKLYDALLKNIRTNRGAIGDATSDVDLQPHASDQAKAMAHVLSEAKGKLYVCQIVIRKLRAIAQWADEKTAAYKRYTKFLTQVAAKTVPKNLHCLTLHLSTDYYTAEPTLQMFIDYKKLEDPSLYHYALFSDNVLATSVVVNSTIAHVAEPEKHVFHIITDKLNIFVMRMWFLMNSPPGVTVYVDNVDDFKWLNSSYCPVLRQLESAAMQEFYFKAHKPVTTSAADANLKYRNPKYLSMLNHLRFYLPEVFPKLDKILFLDDDIVVQKDLTPLWSIDLKGKVNGAVETCKGGFHTFDKYLNFSNPLVSKEFDPNACGWAFGMNMFDLNAWKEHNITGKYHDWQNANENRTVWQLGTLPAGLLTFYKLTYPLNRSWHVLGLGYDPALNMAEIESAAVIHYNGNQKPWLELAFEKYKPFWTKYVFSDNPYLHQCHIKE